MLLLDVVSQILQIVGALAILAAAYTYVVHRKQLNFDVITKCMERFRNIVAEMDSPDQATKERAKKQYVDLCNEQLFYFGSRYLPDAVVHEWLDGMIDYLPQTTNRPQSNEAPSAHCEKDLNCKKNRIDPKLLEGYSKISEAFYVGGEGPYNLGCSNERGHYIERIKGQIQRDEDMFEALADLLKAMERTVYFSLKDWIYKRRRAH